MKFNLEERLIEFSVGVFTFAQTLPDNRVNNHLCGQLIRSASAPSLMYAEANAAESTADFIHKMGMALKEMRETNTCLRMLSGSASGANAKVLELLIEESRQLILILAASINTARKKLR